MKSLIHTFVIVTLFLLLTGCGLKNSDESSHPLFKRAVKAQKANEIKLAVRYFNRFLSLRPDSAKTHLILASIYDENLDKPLRAVHHYELFLEIAPNSLEAGNVRKWLDAARKKYYYLCRLKYNDPEDVGVLQNSLYANELELKKLKQELKKLKLLQKRLVQYAREMRKRENIKNSELTALQKTLRQTLNELEETRIKLKEMLTPKKEEKKEEKTVEPEKITAPEEENAEEIKEKPIEEKKKDENIIAEPKEKPEAKSETKIPEAKLPVPEFLLKEIEEEKKEIDAAPRTYTVKRGDSLSSISRQFYGSSRYYKLIFAANRTILSTEKSLMPGQVLTIPANIKK